MIRGFRLSNFMSFEISSRDNAPTLESLNFSQPAKNIPDLTNDDSSTVDNSSKSGRSKTRPVVEIPSAIDDAEYVPEQIQAERDSPTGGQLLIQWEGYPLKKDWTWESKSSLMERVPAFIKAWTNSRSEIPGDADVYIVEKIFQRRKYEGVAHYLVKWKGYEEAIDRTWEPADTLSVDVPDLVEEFEAQKRKRGRKPKGVKVEKIDI